MSKKPIISKEAQFLLRLLRIALGTEEPNADADHALPLGGGDGGRLWHEVIRLSYEHKVSALAADGLKKLLEAENVGDQISRLLDYPIIKTWFDDVENVEYGYAYYVEVLKTLCQIFVEHGLTPIILKGYGLSLNYPIPSHRGAGDIDIFLIDKDGNPAAEKGDQIAKEVLGLEVEKKPKMHHSHFTFKGLTVENHCELSKAIHDKESEHSLVRLLKELLLKKQTPLSINKIIYFPSADCNAIFLVRHMFRHFYLSGFTIRQMCDWMMFLQTHYDDINWEMITKALKDSNMKSFADALNWALVKYFAMNESIVPKFKKDDDFADHLIQVALCTPPTDTFLDRLLFYYRNRWKIRYSKDEHWLKPMLRTTFTHLRHPLKFPLIKRK